MKATNEQLTNELALAHSKILKLVAENAELKESMQYHRTKEDVDLIGAIARDLIKTRKERDELKDQNQKLMVLGIETAKHADQRYDALAKKLDATAQEELRLRGALEFYGDKSQWESPSGKVGITPMWMTMWNVAQQALLPAPSHLAEAWRGLEKAVLTGNWDTIGKAMDALTRARGIK